MFRLNNRHLRKEYEEITSKEEKIEFSHKNAEEDNHKIFQNEKKKRPKRRQKRMIKRPIRRNMRLGTSRRIQI